MSVTIHVKLKRETDKAILVEHDGADIWLPKSQIDSPVRGPVGTLQDIDISDWIAEQKDLITSGVERYVVEPLPLTSSVQIYAVKDVQANPIHVMCQCSNARDANIIAASLELTKNKL